VIMSDEGGTYEFETYTLRDEDCEYIRKCLKQEGREGPIYIPLMRNADNRQIHYDNVEFPEKHEYLKNYVYARFIMQFRSLPENYESPGSIADYERLPREEKLYGTEQIFFIVTDHPFAVTILNDRTQITADELYSCGMKFAKYRLTDGDCEYIWECIKPRKIREMQLYIPLIRNIGNKKACYGGVEFPRKYKELAKFVRLRHIEQYDFLRAPYFKRITGAERLYFAVLHRPLSVFWLNGKGPTSIIPGYTVPLEFS